MSEEDTSDEVSWSIRTAEEIGQRALALFCVVGLASGAPAEVVRRCMAEDATEPFLTPKERAFVYADVRKERDEINFGWKAEALYMLLWAIGVVDELPGPDEQCDTAVFHDVMPPGIDISVAEFIASLKLREDTELREMEERLYDLNSLARCRSSDPDYRPSAGPVDGGIANERHYGMLWVCGYEGQAWDDITTDT
jgi:hypothetical protein